VIGYVLIHGLSPSDKVMNRADQEKCDKYAALAGRLGFILFVVLIALYVRNCQYNRVIDCNDDGGRWITHEDSRADTCCIGCGNEPR